MKTLIIPVGDPTVRGGMRLTLALDPREVRDPRHELVLDYSVRSSSNYSLEDWADTMCKHDGRGIQMSEGTIYPTRAWGDMTLHEQKRAVAETVYRKKVGALNRYA